MRIDVVVEGVEVAHFAEDLGAVAPSPEQADVADQVGDTARHHHAVVAGSGDMFAQPVVVPCDLGDATFGAV